MNNNVGNIKLYILTISLMIMRVNVFSQDTNRFVFDSVQIVATSKFTFSDFHWSSYSTNSEYSFSHSPTQEDSVFCDKFKHLIIRKPNKKNYSDYYYLAKSLWELERLSEAENMLLKIVNSKDKFYTSNYYHSSDIPSDKTTNIYGYGSFTSNFKNDASCYLAKIYLEQEKYKEALQYIKYADKKYVVIHNCGTGYRNYREKIDGLYALCYYGLSMYDTIINKFLHNYSDYYSGTLVKAIKKKLTPEQISKYLLIAENSIECIVDTFQSSTYISHNFGTENEKEEIITYISGTATMELFGMQINMDKPDLKNGEIASKELFFERFKETGFYKALIEKNE